MPQSEQKLPAGRKQAWSTPTLSFDGELEDFVQATRKPPTETGEAGDPGHRPASA
jgi:hypothetical protein